MAEPPPAKRPRFDDLATFKVLVGPKEVPFMLHENIACSHSKFFRAAMDGKFREAEEKVVRLAESDVGTFNLYAQWIYFHDNVIGDLETSNIKSFGLTLEYCALAKLYVLADLLDDMRLRNRTTDCIKTKFVKSNTIPGVDTVSIAYSQVAATSTLRKLVLYLYARYGTSLMVQYIRGQRDSMPTDFIFDLCLEWGLRARDKDAQPQSACAFHEHNEDFPACGSK